MSDHVPSPSTGTAEVLVLSGARLPGVAGPRTIIVSGGQVRSVGPADIEVPAGVPRIDLDGRTVVPGLWDRHAHLAQWAVARRRVDVREATGPREAAAMVAAAAAGTDPAEPLVGWGFRYGSWREEPHADLLEEAVPGRAVLITSIDLHTAWCSPAGLRRVGAADHPTGVLQERDCYRAMGLFDDLDRDTVDGFVSDALTAAAARGITGIIDFEFGDALPDWQRRIAAGRLPLRVVTTVYPDHLDTAIGRGLATGAVVPGSDGLLTVGPLKVFVDGSLNSRTALCHDPYPPGAAGDLGTGRLETTPDQLHDLLRRAADHGLETAVHAIGDRAVALAIDAFEATGARGRIEHAQLIAPADVPRLARPGLAVGVQPAHLIDDRDVAERLWPGRTDRAFPLAELLAAGVHVEFGSDAPVAPLDPWLAIAAAVSRTGDDRDAWHPEHRIEVADALAASACGRRTIAAGDPADLVVLEDDPTTATRTGLLAPAVVATMCAGRWTYRAAGGADTW